MIKIMVSEWEKVSLYQVHGVIVLPLRYIYVKNMYTKCVMTIQLKMKCMLFFIALTIMNCTYSDNELKSSVENQNAFSIFE